jgi:Flp pilus assembly pilin Flp
LFTFSSLTPGRQKIDSHGRDTNMDLLRKLYVKADGFARGQTMAEYVLIVSAIAVVVYAGYQTTGSTISTLLSSVDSQM